MVTNHASALPLLLIISGSLIPVWVWAKRKVAGIPFGPLLGIQSITVYALPILTDNESVFKYTSGEITSAAVEVLLFGIAIGGGMLFAARSINIQRPNYCHRFKFLSGQGHKRLYIIGPLLLALSVGFLAARIEGVFQSFPSGLYSILRTIFEAAGLGGGVISGFVIGSRKMKPAMVILFWILFALHSICRTVDFTLFPTVGLVMATCLGIFMGSGRPPVVALAVLSTVLGFFSLSKFEMRNAHWIPGEAYAAQSLDLMQSRIIEWGERSWEHVFSGEKYIEDRERIDSQKISSRINNLANLLDVQYFVNVDEIPPLNGETYWLIPKLLIPRLFWPEKPRTHEGMVLLNVYFGRQTLEATFHTYVAWGLLAEAYGNFGSITGAIVLGLVLGVLVGWVELKTRFYPLNSLQAMLALAFLVQLGGSIETVASIWVTSIFQMLIAIVIASALLVERTRTPQDSE